MKTLSMNWHVALSMGSSNAFSILQNTYIYIYIYILFDMLELWKIVWFHWHSNFGPYPKSPKQDFARCVSVALLEF